jgi:hypothetical protein
MELTVCYFQITANSVKKAPPLDTAKLAAAKKRKKATTLVVAKKGTKKAVKSTTATTKLGAKIFPQS